MKKKMALLPLAVLAGAWLLLPQHGWCAKQPSPSQSPAPADAVLQVDDSGNNQQQQQGQSGSSSQQESQSEQIFYHHHDIRHAPWDQDWSQSSQAENQTQQQGDPEP